MNKFWSYAENVSNKLPKSRLFVKKIALEFERFGDCCRKFLLACLAQRPIHKKEQCSPAARMQIFRSESTVKKGDLFFKEEQFFVK